MIKVGIIGYGYWGPNLVRNFMNVEGCTVTHICDLDNKKLEIAKKKNPSISTTNSINEIFGNSEIDAIVIATPVSTHYDLALKALESNKHILVEKPLTDNVEKAKILGTKAKEKDKILMIDHTYLYTPAIQKIKELMDSDSIGKIQYIDSTRINLGLFQTDINVMWDLAVHDIAICCYLLNEKPISVQATGISHTENGLENMAYITLHYSTKKIIHFNCSWVSPVKIRYMLIGGDKKMIVFNDLETTEKIKIYDSSYENKYDSEHTQNFLTDYRIGDIYIPKIPQIEGLKNMAEDFINSIQNNTEPTSNYDLGLTIVKILECAQKSIKNNGAKVNL
jgi:predicted dehydrogenase